VAHLGEQVTAFLARPELDLGDLGKGLAEHVPVVDDRRPQFVKPPLLVEGKVVIGSFAGAWVARVVDRVVRCVPRHITAGGSAVHTGNLVAELLPRGDVEQIEGPVLGASFGERNGDEAPVVRGFVKIDRREAGWIDRVRVDEDPFARKIANRREQNEEGLLLRRKALDGEEPSPMIGDGEIVGRVGAHQRPNPLDERVAPGV